MKVSFAPLNVIASVDVRRIVPTNVLTTAVVAAAVIAVRAVVHRVVEARDRGGKTLADAGRVAGRLAEQMLRPSAALNVMRVVPLSKLAVTPVAAAFALICVAICVPLIALPSAVYDTPCR